MNLENLTPSARVYAAHNPDQPRTPLPRDISPFYDPATISSDGDPNPDHEPNGEYDEDGNVIEGLLVAFALTGVVAVVSYFLYAHREAVMHFWRLF